MFDDILNNKKVKKSTKKSLIESLQYNIKEKSKLIDDLIKKITLLEEELKKYKNG